MTKFCIFTLTKNKRWVLIRQIAVMGILSQISHSFFCPSLAACLQPKECMFARFLVIFVASFWPSSSTDVCLWTVMIMTCRYYASWAYLAHIWWGALSALACLLLPYILIPNFLTIAGWHDPQLWCWRWSRPSSLSRYSSECNCCSFSNFLRCSVAPFPVYLVFEDEHFFLELPVFGFVAQNRESFERKTVFFLKISCIFA